MGEKPPKSGGATFRVCPELLYVIGAVLGDGYLFESGGHHLVGLDVRSGEFAERFASKISRVVGVRVRAHYYAGGRIWYVRTRSDELSRVITKVRRELSMLALLVRRGTCRENALEFLAGLFDAEGCVKVVREEARLTPKLCLDITNTSKELLDLANSMMSTYLGFAGRYSLQRDDKRHRKPVYHLRVYRRRHVRTFLDGVNTVKLTPIKKQFLHSWLLLEK